MGFLLPFKKIALVLLILLQFTFTSAEEDGEKEKEDPINFLIESEVKLLDDSMFLGDRYLIQQVDRVNKFTTYSNPEVSPDKPGANVFFRHSSDIDKNIVVLKSGEDYLKKTGKKSVYVVLRRVKSEPTHYIVFYAYVR